MNKFKGYDYMGDSTTTRNIVSDTLLVAAVPAWSYAVGFSYQSSYVEYFGLPSRLATPSLSTTLIAAGALAGILLSYLFIADFIWRLAPRTDSATAAAIRRVLAFSLLVGLLFFPVIKERAIWIFALAIVGIYVIIEFLFPLVSQRGLSSYEEKLAAQEQIEAHTNTHSLYGLLRNAIGVAWMRLGLFAGITILLASTLGRTHAREEDTFLVFEDSPNSAVIVVDGDMLVAANFDPKTNTLSGSFFVRKLADSAPWKLRQKKIGRLQVNPSQ